MTEILSILALAYLQNVSFSIVSRARNRSSWKYHLFAAAGSNTIWFLTFRQLVLAKMSFLLFVPYTAGTVAGSLSGAWLSMKVERWLQATSDDHLKK